MDNKRAVVVTGVNGLIGRNLANRLADLDYCVIGVDLLPKHHELNHVIHHIQFDLTKLDLFDDLKHRIQSLTDNLYGLVNNAAANPKIELGQGFGLLEELGVTSWQKDVTLNLSAPLFLVKTLLSLFNRSDHEPCKIINVCSTYGLVAPNQSIYTDVSIKLGAEILKPVGYSVTKAGLVMLTKYLATYPGCKGININGIAPGGIENGQDEAFLKSYKALVPLNRMGKVEDLLGTFELLLSQESNYIHGQIISVDGGWTAW